MRDDFEGLARHYDTLMSHVNYERWLIVASELACLLPQQFRHLDAACGTGVLLNKLRHIGWNTTGADLSVSMLDVARRRLPDATLVAADLRAMPYLGAFNYITCLFDSINFLLDEADLQTAMRNIAAALKPGGLVYFDVVTERMVLQHFAEQEWTESQGRLRTRWVCQYDRAKRISRSDIYVGSGPARTILERIYEPEQIENALHAAGFELLGAFDAETWRPVGRRTVRIDYVAVKGEAAPFARQMEGVKGRVRFLMR